MKHKLPKELTRKETMQFMDRRPLQYGFMIFVLLIACLQPVLGEGAQQNRHAVLIDPAHGGEDTGVVADKLREKDLTLNLALLVREESQKGENLLVRLTRSTDRTMSIAERIKTSGDFHPECIVSLHVNAGFGKQSGGYEVYFPGFRQNASREEGSTPVLKDMAKNRSLNESVRLAQAIQAALETVFPRKGRGLRDAPSPLLDGLTIPGLVVEVGFATNPEERKSLTGQDTQRAIARALVRGLREYFLKTP
jgi:N-acetylmuramoyl-L-alanine amidase